MLTTVSLFMKGNTMNASEKKYACKRIREIGQAKSRKIHDHYHDTTPRRELAPKEKAKLIASGKVNLLKGLQYISCYSVESCFDWDTVEKPIKKKYAEREAKMDKLQKRINALIDKVMLGSSDEAVKLLEDFCKED